MAGLLHNVIASAEADPATQTVRLTWRDGSVTSARFSHLAGIGVFAAMRDPAFFSKAEVADAGHVLAWPGDIEFDADALWFEAHPEDQPAERLAEAARLPA